MRISKLFWNSLGLKVAIPLVLGTMTFALAMIYVVYNIQMTSVEEQAIKQAAGVNAQLVDIEAILAEQKRLTRHLVHQVSERLNKRELVQVRLISSSPIDPGRAQVCVGEKSLCFFGQRSTRRAGQPGDRRW